MGIEVGLDVGIDVGLDVGIDVGSDVSIDVGSDESRHTRAEPQSRRLGTEDVGWRRRERRISLATQLLWLPR